MDELDPAAPAVAEAGTEDRDIANFGIDLKGDFPPGDPGLNLPEAFATATVEFAIDRALAFLQQCETSHPRVTYGLGKKIKPGQVPGRDFAQVDCSGFVREAVRQSTNLGSGFPDGSVVQHDWVQKRGFARDTVESGSQQDRAVRIAFLAPNATSSGIGHVVLIFNGRTLESHGGVGPDSRQWTGGQWQAKTSVFVLCPNPSS